MSDETKFEDLEVSRRGLLKGSAAIVGTAMATGAVTLAAPSIARAQSYDAATTKFSFSTPFSGQDSFSGTIGGLKKGMELYGGELTITDASFDLKKQNDQIATIVASKPDIFMVLPVDPVGCANAIQGAVTAGIPTFVLDTIVPGVAATQCSLHDNYGMGAVTAKWIAEAIGGKGKIGVMQLPINETWNMRDRGMEFVLRDYPEIEVVTTWAFDPTGKVTPRAAADGMLTAHPDLAAIWTAWDNAGMEAGLAALAAGRPDLITCGTDGGKAAFENISSGGPFKASCAQVFYQQAVTPIYFAHQFLQGNPVPRTVLHPSYLITAEELEGRDADLLLRYDEPGIAEELGWTRVL